MTHKIRLRGPWELCLKTENTEFSVINRLKMPTTLVEIRENMAKHEANYYLRRWFNCPTNLSTEEQVSISVRDTKREMTALLNQKLIGRCTENLEVDITTLLQPRNELVFELPRLEDFPNEDELLWEEVALVIQTM